MRFTIRDLLWLTVVLILGVAWWVDRSRLNQRLDQCRSESERLQVELKWKTDLLEVRQDIERIIAPDGN